jgi:hypothetical protein
LFEGRIISSKNGEVLPHAGKLPERLFFPIATTLSQLNLVKHTGISPLEEDTRMKVNSRKSIH